MSAAGRTSLSVNRYSAIASESVIRVDFTSRAALPAEGEASRKRAGTCCAASCAPEHAQARRMLQNLCTRCAQITFVGTLEHDRLDGRTKLCPESGLRIHAHQRRVINSMRRSLSL